MRRPHRPHLLHNSLGERRHSLRQRRRRGAGEPVLELADAAVARVREAGGPVDRASYSCQCGCFFLARVSTTVSCPHCGTGQAW